MGNNTFVELQIPEAVELADYYGIKDDLDSARSTAQLLLELSAAERPDYRLVDPLWTALFVRYARAFTSGVRKRLDKEILAILTENQIQHHTYFIAIRDKHIAHSVNSFEENQPIARYWAERVHEEGFSAISCNRTRTIGLDPISLSMFVEITTELIKGVQKRIDQEETKVLAIVRAMPIQDILTSARQNSRNPNNDPFRRRPR